FFCFQAEDGIRDDLVTGVQTCALPICEAFMQQMQSSVRRAFIALKTGGGTVRPTEVTEASGIRQHAFDEAISAAAELVKRRVPQIGRASWREQGVRQEGAGSRERESSK